MGSDLRISAEQVAAHLGLHRHPRSWRGECPACGYSDTFCVKPSRGAFPKLFCAGCNDRGVLQQAVCARLGGGGTPPRSAAPSNTAAAREARQAAARRLWNGADQAAHTPAARYLACRGIGLIASSPALRWRRDVSHPEHSGSWCAMIAEVVDADSAFIGVHRTYLRGDGNGKADATPAKASLGPIWGGAVRLAAALPNPAKFQLVIGEGIESAAAAGIVFNVPAWAALSAGNLANGLLLPPDIRNVLIAADHDPAATNGRRPGQDAANAAARRWRAEGRTVAIALPDLPGRDFNDVLIDGANG